MSLQVTIHSIGAGKCQHSDKECDSGLTVTMGDFKEVFLSQKSFLSFVKMMLPKVPRAAAKQPTNGQPQGASS